jgi:hypothetical protein
MNTYQITSNRVSIGNLGDEFTEAELKAMHVNIAALVAGGHLAEQSPPKTQKVC